MSEGWRLEISTQGAWQMKAIGFLSSSKALTNLFTAASWRRASAFKAPAGKEEGVESSGFESLTGFGAEGNSFIVVLKGLERQAEAPLPKMP